MEEKEYEEMTEEIKNQMHKMGEEITASDSLSLALKIGKIAYVDDTFKHATLKQIASAICNFAVSYLNSRDDYRDLSDKNKRRYNNDFLDMLSILFILTDKAIKETKKDMEINKDKCDHMGTLEDYILNEGYWLCTNCKEKIKKHVKK